MVLSVDRCNILPTRNTLDGDNSIEPSNGSSSDLPTPAAGYAMEMNLGVSSITSIIENDNEKEKEKGMEAEATFDWTALGIFGEEMGFDISSTSFSFGGEMGIGAVG